MRARWLRELFGDWERGCEGERLGDGGVLERVRPRDSERAAEGERDGIFEVLVVKRRLMAVDTKEVVGEMCAGGLRKW